MTLKEKFIGYCDHQYANREDNAENCVEIADDYAIEFAEWMALSCTQMQKILSQKAKYFHLIKRDYFTAKELLEIFKKEKGL